MITRCAVIAAALGFALGCGDSHSGGGGAAGMAGGSGVAGSGGDSQLIGDTGCSFVTPTMPPPDLSCAPGCTRIGGIGRSDALVYQLACVPDASLERQTPPTANEVCMTSPIDRQDYFVGSPISAQAVADVCWVLCALNPEDPDFEDWLELDFEVWLGRCGDIWEL